MRSIVGNKSGKEGDKREKEKERNFLTKNQASSGTIMIVSQDRI